MTGAEEVAAVVAAGDNAGHSVAVASDEHMALERIAPGAVHRGRGNAWALKEAVQA